MYAAGTHLKVARRGYSHHGLATGEGTVVHYSGLADGLRAGPVEEVSLAQFAGGRAIKVIEHAEREYGGVASVERARSRTGEGAYRVDANNCEHFVLWAIQGLHESRQVERGTVGFKTASSAAAGKGALMVVGATGQVAGLSGPGIMSGLAATGFGGAVGGMATLAGGAGLGAALFVNNTVLAVDDSMDDDERVARRAGQAASIGGALAAGAGGIGAVAASGSVAGLGAAGISSGLAAVGGSMAGGVTVVVGAPVIAAAAGGLLVAAAARRINRGRSRKRRLLE